MTAPLIRGDEIAMAEIVCDVRIIVLSPIFANSVPGSEQESKVFSLETELGIDPIPASG